MSSNDYHSYNSTLDDYNSALRCLKIKSYQRALIYLESLLEKDPYNLDGYLLKGQCELNLNNEGDAIKNVNQGLKIIESNHKEDDEFLIMKIKLLQMRSQIYEKLEIPEKAALDINEIKLILKEKDKNGRIYAGLQQDFPFANGHGIDNQENGIIKDENGEHNQEAQIVYELFQKSSENEMLTTEFSIVHVVSMKWFEKWKTYTNFSMEMTNSPIKSRNSKDMLEEEIERQHPGPIISDDIIDKEAEVLFDPDPVREYCNIVLKEGITENKDFIIFPHPVWKYLHSLYTGQDIKRFVTCLNDETEQTIVEVWLKKINVLVAPPISKNQKYVQCEVKTLYISKKETVKELRQKITRIFKTMSNIPDREVFENCRLWKLDPKKNFKQLLKTAGGTKESVILKGSRLTDGVCLEDTELGDTDIVICEYKVGKTWKFISEEEHLQIVLSHCGYCGANHENLLFCECKTIKYCNSSCQKSHRAQHKEDCLKAKAKLNKDHQIIKQFKLKNTKFGPNSRYGVCGLQNLGNTCFMNSSLQCLSNISELTYYFLENRFVKDLNKHNRLGTGGRLAAAYAELMKELWHGSDSYVSPWHIKKIIAEVASQFSGYSQHDAGEFLSYLIDGLHEDLNKVVDKPYIEAPEVENQPDEIAAKKSWENHMKRNESIIVDQLHGQFKSKLICPDCNKISITFDPFMTLSLPIPHVNTIPVTLYFIYKNNKVLPVKITLNIDPTAPSTTIVEKTAQRISLPEQALELIFIKEQTFMRMKFSDYDIKAIKEEDGALFVYQTHSPDIDGPLEEFNKEDKIKVELEMLGYASNHLSFSRLLYIPRDITLKQLHLHIYYIMRGYLAPVIAQDSMLFPFTIDLEKTDPETLESEYHAFQGLGNNAAKITPYKLVYIDIIRDQQTLPYQEERLLSDEITIRNPLTLGVVFNREFATDLIKLNKCHDLEENNSVSKDPKSYSIIDCLNLFTTPEVLDQENLWYCGQCKQHKQATKKMDIYKLPKVLIVHLKRFKTSRVHSIGSYFFTGGSSKITALVEFPVENLDLRPYTLGKWDEPPIYDLFAITNHYGNLGGGHYTAYVKNQQKNAWLDYNDSNVSTQDADDLVSPAAYLLFYKRREVERQPEARPENRE